MNERPTTVNPERSTRTRSKRLRIVIDLLMAGLLLAQMCYPFIGDEVHPWIGIAFAVVVGAHLIINRAWWAGLRRGSWSVLRVAQTALIVLSCVGLIAVPVSGILMSPLGLAVFPEISGMSLIRLVHLSGSYGLLVLLSLHAGLHVSRLRLGSRAPQKRSSVLRVAWWVGVAVVAAYGAFAFGKHGLFNYVSLQSQFVFWDYEASVIVFLVDYLAMMVFFATLAHLLGRLVRVPKTTHQTKQGTPEVKQRTPEVRRGTPEVRRGVAERRSEGQHNPLDRRPSSGIRFTAATSLVALSTIVVASGSLASAGGSQASAWQSNQASAGQNGQDASPLHSDTSTSVAGEATTARPEPTESPRILIAYFTWADNVSADDRDTIDVDAVTSASVIPPGNVGSVAHHIQDATNANIYPILTEQPYPSNYDACLEQAIRESDAQARPQLTGPELSLDDYDVVFLGYPNWWYSAPMAVLSFLEQHDFSGKTVIPFCVHGTGGLSGSTQAVREAIPEATVLDPLSIAREQAESSEPTIDAWVSELGYSAEGTI